MPEKSWKVAERKIAEWLTRFAKELSERSNLEPPTEFKRNGACSDSSDRNRNSDVDAIHSCFYIKRLNSPFIYGITVEVTRRLNGLSRLYKISAETYILYDRSRRILLTTLEGFEFIYSSLVNGKSLDLHVFKAFPVSRLPSIIIEKLDQSLRYGVAKQLFPIVAFRKPRRKIKIALDTRVLEEASRGIAGNKTKIWS